GADLGTGWTPTCRGAANAWECDHLGHWNARYYVDRFAQGVPPRDGIATMQHIRYRRELNAGDPFVVLAKSIETQEATIRTYHKLYATHSGVLSATLDVIQ